jgi:hypothetical protein
MEHQFRSVNRSVSEKMKALRKDVESESGIFARLGARALGPLLLWTTRREERRLARGKTYEPPTFLERTNWAST